VPDVTPVRPSNPPQTRLRTVAGWISDVLVEMRGSDPDRLVTGLTLSSGAVLPGDLYAALPGSRAHGADYAADAVRAGAVAVLTDPAGADVCAEHGVPVLVVHEPRAVLGRLAAAIYGNPASDLRLVAVTGTAGKTTTTRLAEAAVNRTGRSAAVVGTVGTRIGGLDVPGGLTTPEAPDLHALFAVMRERHVQVCAMEVSSHALVMGRVDGVRYDVAGFTNLGRDHLDFHTDMEDYYRAKAMLFTPERARRGLVNLDDEYGRRLVADATIPVRTFSVNGADADWTVRDVVSAPTGSRFTVHAPDGRSFPGAVALPGGYNIANALCAIAALGELGLDAAAVAEAVGQVSGVPGRLERIDAGQDFLAVVDYAHKPDSVAAALEALRPETTGRLVIVLGAGGDRDPGKRPLMGEVAARLADVLVVTDDNPRSEDAAAIRAAILEGARQVPDPERAELHEVGDRRAAIRLAVSLGHAGDTVVVAGKGHERGQLVNGVTHDFDDRDVLREELAVR